MNDRTNEGHCYSMACAEGDRSMDRWSIDRSYITRYRARTITYFYFYFYLGDEIVELQKRRNRQEKEKKKRVDEWKKKRRRKKKKEREVERERERDDDDEVMSCQIKTRPVEKKWNKIDRTGDSLSLCCRARDRHTDWPTAIHVTEVKNTFCLSLTFGSIPFSTAFNQFCSALLMTATSVTFYPIPSHPNPTFYLFDFFICLLKKRGEERRDE